jgi:sugar porter (SP) family MFS transporter
MQQNKLITYSLVAALAGFIFGFDTVVISGANQPIKELWQTSPLFHGFFIMSMALWGTVFGAAFGGVPAQKMGRKKTLIWIGILFTVSALGTALAPDPYSFSFFRFLGGLGIGASSVVAPTYISEISTAKSRGRLTALYQFNIVFGILVAFLSNYFLQGFDGANDWRWMLGVLALPSLVYTLLVFIVPESPRWLVVTKNDVAAAKIIFPLIGETNPDEAINNMLADSQNNTQQKSENILTAPKYKKVIGLSFLLAFFNQLSGINFILYYAPEILEKAGLATKESLSSSIAIGGINLLFTFVGIYLIDRLGRRQLLIIGSIGYILSLALVGWCFQTSANPSLLLSFLLLFIASHAIGQGAVIWVFIAEIFPTRVRAWGQSFGCSVHWVFAAIITLVTPIFLDETDGIYKDNPYPIFYFFALMMMLQLLWVLLKVPETKGVSLEDLEKKLVG